MKAPIKLAAFAAALAATFGLGLGLGQAVGPLDSTDPPAVVHDGHGAEGGQ